MHSSRDGSGRMNRLISPMNTLWCATCAHLGFLKNVLLSRRGSHAQNVELERGNCSHDVSLRNKRQSRTRPLPLRNFQFHCICNNTVGSLHELTGVRAKDIEMKFENIKIFGDQTIETLNQVDKANNIESGQMTKLFTLRESRRS